MAKVFGLDAEREEESHALLGPSLGWRRCFHQGRRPRVLLTALISSLLFLQLFSSRSNVLFQIYSQTGYEHHPLMRVALLYAGNVRSFVYEPVWRNHLEHMIRPLSQGNVELSVFMALDEENDKSVDNIGLKRTPLVELLDRFQVKSVFYRLKDNMKPLQCRPAEGCKQFKENIHRKFSPIYWGQAQLVNAAFQLARSYEHENDVKFDWFIRVRPDFVLPSPIPSLPNVANHIDAPVCGMGPKLLKRNHHLTCAYNITDTTIVTVNAERTDPFCDKYFAMPRRAALVFVPETMQVCNRDKYVCSAFEKGLHHSTEYSPDRLFAVIAESNNFTMVKEERILPIIMRPKFVACFQGSIYPWDCEL